MRKQLAIIGLAFLGSACDNDTAPPLVTNHPAIPALLTLSPSSLGVMTSAGDTRNITVVARNSDGAVIDSPEVQWVSNATTVATVTDNGAAGATVVAVGDGLVTITARSGAIESSLQFTVHRILASVTLTAPHRVLEYGSATQLVATAFDARHNAIPNVQGFKFSSDNPSTVFVQPNGVATALFRFPQLADAIITASLTRDGITATSRFNFIVGEPADIDFGALMLTENVQPVRPPTTGSGIALMTRFVDHIAFRVIWSELSGPVSAVQIRGPATVGNQADLFVSLAPLPSLDSLGLITGSITSANIRSQNGRAPISLDSLSALMCRRNAYIEVHTGRFPNGEIRGQFTCFQ